MNTIYKLNFANGDFYIGQTTNLKIRLAHHCNQKGKGSPKLEQAFSVSEFTDYEILEQDCENIDERETYWINKLRPTLNVLPGGKAMRGLSHPRSKYSEEQILQVLNLFLHSAASYQDISDLTEVSLGTVRDICFLRSHTWATEGLEAEILTAQKCREKTYTVYDPHNVKHTFTNAAQFQQEHDLPQNAVNNILNSVSGFYKGWSREPKQAIRLIAPDGEVFDFDSHNDAKEFLRYNNLPTASITKIIKKHKTSKGWIPIHKS